VQALAPWLPCVTGSNWRVMHVHLQAKRKRQHMGDLKIVVAGCVAQQEGAALLRRVPEVDLVMGPQYANRSGPAANMPTQCLCFMHAVPLQRLTPIP